MAEQRIASLSGRQRIRTFFVRKLRRRRTTLPPIIYVLCAPSLAGGVKVVAEHVHGLCARGHDARIYCPPGDFSWFKKAPLPFRMFPDADALDAALREVVGIKVATWWQTAFSVQTSRGDGDRGRI